MQLAQTYSEPLPEWLASLVENMYTTAAGYQDPGVETSSQSDNPLKDSTAIGSSRTLFVLLAMARGVAEKYQAWRAVFLRRRLNSLVDKIRRGKDGSKESSGPLVARVFLALKDFPRKQQLKARRFRQLQLFIKSYKGFSAWQNITWHAEIQQLQTCIHF